MKKKVNYPVSLYYRFFQNLFGDVSLKCVFHKNMLHPSAHFFLTDLETDNKLFLEAPEKS